MEDVRHEGVFGADGFARAIRLDLPIVDATGDIIIPAPGFAEMLLKEGEGFRFQVSPLIPCLITP